MAMLLQHRAAAFIARLSTAGAGNYLAEADNDAIQSIFGWIIARPNRGRSLTLELDHLMNPGQHLSKKLDNLPIRLTRLLWDGHYHEQ